MKEIAHIRTDFPTKFGLPRQSGLVDALKGSIVFAPEYRDANALRGLEEYSHIWLIWKFSEAVRDGWSPTVRPPRLGGNTAMGVFATRSPFRPNPIGLSCVRLESIEYSTPDGPILHIAGADLMDNTPIYDIKPYLPYVDSHPDALGGFAHDVKDYALSVDIPSDLLPLIPSSKLDALIGVLSQDPRPGYRRSDPRPYAISFAGLDIKFVVRDGTAQVTAVGLCPPAPPAQGSVDP